MRRQELVISVRFEASRTANSHLCTAFEMVLPVHRRTLRRPTQEAHTASVAELAERKKKAR